MTRREQMVAFITRRFEESIVANAHLPIEQRLDIIANDWVDVALAHNPWFEIALKEKAGTHPVNQLADARRARLRDQAEGVAAPIAARHGVSVADIFGASRARSITPARGELCVVLLAQAWSKADVARALGITPEAVHYAAKRAQLKQQRKVSNVG